MNDELSKWLDEYVEWTFKPLIDYFDFWSTFHKLFEPTRELIETSANIMWGTAGQKPEMRNDFQKAAEKYVNSLFPLLTSRFLKETPFNNKTLTKILGIIPPDSYLHTVQETAYLMWNAAGQQPEMSLDYWVAAERYMSSIILSATRFASTSGNVQQTLGTLLKAFPPNTYFYLVQESAYFMWKIAGWYYELPSKYWLAAERYVNSLVALTTKFSSTNLDVPENLNILLKALPPDIYFMKVQDLAKAMWKHGNCQGEMPAFAHEFWLAAEDHILAVMSGVARMAVNITDVISLLDKNVINFSSEKHLDCIQKLADSKWKAAGEPYGDDLSFFVEAEKEVLAQLRQGHCQLEPGELPMTAGSGRGPG